MEKGEKGERAIAEPHEPIDTSVSLFPFPSFPFFLITHAVTSLG